MKFYTLFGYKPERQDVLFTEESVTDDSFADECDIHHIIGSFGQTGMVASPGAKDPALLQYGDATLFPDYQTAKNLTIQVEEEFLSLPSSVRAEFGNNPEELLMALGSQDKDVIAKLEKFGLKDSSKPIQESVSTPSSNNASTQEA